MNRNLLGRAAVCLAVVVCVSVALESQANACLGLFRHKCCGESSCSSCSSEPSCGCAAPAATEPSCGCAAAPAAAEPSCAAPAAAAPAEPSCGCSASSEPSCGCAKEESSCGCGHRCRLFGGLGGLFKRHCCGGSSSCGCSAEPSCGCSG
jgi:hypothetical protein